MDMGLGPIQRRVVDILHEASTSEGLPIGLLRTLAGGDVVDLYAVANGYENLGEAAGFLLLEFGYEIPQRPDSWYRKQTRQQKIREQIHAEKIHHIRLLVFRMIWASWLKTLPEDVRAEATESAWRMSRSMALSMCERGRAS